MYAETTIVAPATPYGYGGISVIRLSGSKCIDIVTNYISQSAATLFKSPRTAITTGFNNSYGEEIDRIIVTYFKQPSSYTGEDVIEISCHGNPAIVQQIINTCCKGGAKMAEPGEFTKRAFLNGKIDLVQAEAVAKLIHSKSLDGANFNNKILSGHLSKQFYALKKNLLGILASIEYSLDISEEEVPPNHHQDILKAMTKTRSTIAPILDGHKQAQLLTSGATVVIAGQPNVGKSTLLNKLSNSDRAIVSEQPGTTRDSLSVSLLLSGVVVTLIDTAGLRVAKNTIEEEGVSRAKKHIKNADLVIFLSSVDIDETPTHPTSDPRLSVLNKIDIPNNKINAKNFDCSISAKEGSGIKKLLNLIKDRLSIYPSITDSAALTTSRQYNGLLETDLALALGIKNLRGGNPALELAAVDVRRSIGALDVILGKTTTEEILDNIFKSFCVGK